MTKNKKQSVKYKQTTVYVITNYPIRPKICSACSRESKIDLHHWKYEWETKEVKKNPILALKNTQPLCMHCHRIANAMKLVDENSDIVQQITKKKEEKWET